MYNVSRDNFDLIISLLDSGERFRTNCCFRLDFGEEILVVVVVVSGPLLSSSNGSFLLTMGVTFLRRLKKDRNSDSSSLFFMLYVRKRNEKTEKRIFFGTLLWNGQYRVAVLWII